MARALVADLYALQELDLESDRSQIEANSLRRSLAEDPTRPAREVVVRARAQAEQARREARDAEAALHEAEARIRKQESRLYGGGTGQRDLSALQAELNHLKAAHADQEERVLGLMLAAEEAESAVAQATEALSAAQREWARRKDDLRARLEAMEAEANDLRARREAQAATIDASLVDRYEAIRRTHGGRAVALVVSGTCQACRVAVTSGALQRARPGTELVPCSNCGRILYMR